MKKKVLSVIVVFGIAIMIAYNVSLSSKGIENLSDLALANIEAMAGPECSGCNISEWCISFCISSNHICRISSNQGWEIDCRYLTPFYY